MIEVSQLELVFLLLLLFVVVFGVLSIRLRIPYPITMVIGGLLLSLVPGIPSVTLNPDLIFRVVLPPLLFSAAWTTSWRDFRHNLVSIFSLAVGLVIFTVAGISLLAPYLFDGFDWRLGFVLAAVVAPTDAIAATAIAKRIGLPQQVVDLLEGESLVNDATGLLALEFATGILVRNHMPTIGEGAATFVLLVAGGIAIGLLLAYVVYRIEVTIDDGPIEITLSILTPYAAYLLAEEVHASGVLAVVACGLFLSRRSTKLFTPKVRLRIWSVWESLTFVLNGLVFVLIGLQLPGIQASIRDHSTGSLIIDGAVFSVVLILLRIAWMYPGASISWFIRRNLLHQHQPIAPARQIFVVGWTGMRGVVSLAAALALPAVLADGSPFPMRGMIIFLTFSAILVTLVLQGLTLPSLIRALGLSAPSGPNCEEQEARRILIAAAMSHLNVARAREGEESAPVFDDLHLHYKHRLDSLQPGSEDSDQNREHQQHQEISLELVRVEREAAVRLRDEGRINDEVLRRLEHELDLNESRLAAEEE